MTADVIVIGGGPAGLSAALVLGRARVNVAVVDAGRPANRVSSGIGGLLGHEGEAPSALRQRALRELDAYPGVRVVSGEVEEAAARDEAFGVRLRDGTVLRAARLLLAGGLRYGRPPVPGIDDFWGTSVFHCPFCDGWEVSDRPLAVLGSGAPAAHLALLVGRWSEDVVLCTDGPAELSAGELERLRASAIRVRDEPIRALVGHGPRLERIAFAAGADEPRAAAFIVPDLSLPDGLAAGLGCEVTDDGLIRADADGRTGVPGVYAAGDAASPLRSVAIAIGAGARTAKAIVLDAVPAPAAAGPA